MRRNKVTTNALRQMQRWTPPPMREAAQEPAAAMPFRFWQFPSSVNLHPTRSLVAKALEVKAA